jgi:hypothetical protein
MARDDFEVHDHIAQARCQFAAAFLDPPLDERMNQRRITEVAQGEEFRGEVLDVHGKPGHAGQSLRDPLAGVGALFHGVGTTGLDDPLAPLQVGLNLLRQAGGHLLEAIDQLGRQLMARDPALLRAIAMIAPTFEMCVPCFQPALLAT